MGPMLAPGRPHPTVDGGVTYLQAWCEQCQEMVLPHRDGRCMWCDAPTGAHDRGADEADQAPVFEEQQPLSRCPDCHGRKNPKSERCRKCAGRARASAPAPCPECGGPKTAGAQRCHGCASAAKRKPRAACPDCGGRKSISAERCRSCASTQMASAERACPECGERKALTAKRCQACANAARRSEHTVCPGCGGRKSWGSRVCVECRRANGWTPPAPLGTKVARCVSEEVITEAYALYQQGLSLRKVAAQVLERTSYKNEKAAANGLHQQFQRRGWPLRDRIAATVVASTIHGRGARRDKNAYKSWRRKQGRERCQGSLQGSGERCSRLAGAGEVFCYFHDPERAEQRRAAYVRRNPLARLSPHPQVRALLPAPDGQADQQERESAAC